MHRLENLEKLIFYLAKKMFGLEKKVFSSFWKRLPWFENLSEIDTVFGEEVV